MSGEQLERICEGEIGQRQFAALETKGIKGLAFINSARPEVQIGICSVGHPIIHPEDPNLKGMKIAVDNSLQAEVAEYCGAAAVFIASSDIYLVFERGIIDAAVTSPYSMVEEELYQVTSFYTGGVPIGYSIFVMIMNKDFFDFLPSDLQQVVVDAAQETRDERWTTGDELFAGYESQLEDNSWAEVHRLTDGEWEEWWEAGIPITKEYVTAEGLAAIEIYDMIQSVNKESGLPYSYIWDPWIYDENGSNYIEIGELFQAINDYSGGKITISQLLQLINLYISHIHE